MTAESLNALADRCEREEASAHLNQAIWFAVRHPGEPDYAWDEYTTSLDAALTLVPEGCGVVAAWSANGAMFQVCSMPLGAVEGQRWFQQCKAQTPAAALTAAALRARAALLTDGANPAPPKVRTPK